METHRPSIRSARPEDLAGIHDLLRAVRLPVDGVAEHLGDFLVEEADGRIAGTVGLEVYGRRALLRSLAVSGDRQGQGRGRDLYRAIVRRARDRGVIELILLTETATGFFAKQGFEMIPRDQAGEEVRGSVEFRHACPASAVCMRLRLT